MCLIVNFWCMCVVIGSCVNAEFGNTFFLDDGSLTEACPFTNFCTKDAKFRQTTNESGICCAPCMCSTECHFHGNCCPDVQHEADDNFQKPVCYFPVFNADERTLYNNKMHFFTGIHSYNTFVSCPSEYKENGVKDLCENSPKVLVSLTLVSDKMGYVYKNKHCAECHGKTSYKSWNLKIRCQTTEDESKIQMGNSLEKFKSCMVWSLPPDPSVGRKSLCYNAIDACNATGNLKTYDDTLEYKCGAYTLYYFYNFGKTTQIFKNIHCFLCNIKGRVGPETCPSKLLEARNDILQEFTGILSRASFSLMSKPVKPKCRKRCQMWQIYDPLFNTCRTLTCQAGTKSFYGECLDIYKNTLGYSLSMLIELRPVDNISTIRDKALALFDYPNNYNDMIRFIKAVSRTTEQYKNKCSLCSAVLAKGDNASIQYLKVLVTFHTNLGCDINTLYESAYKYASTKERLFSITVQQQKVTYQVSVNDELTLKDILELLRTSKVSHQARLCGLPKPFVGDLVCPRITLNSSEYSTFLKSTNQLVSVKQKIRLQTTDELDQFRGDSDENDKDWNDRTSKGRKVSVDFDICSYHYMMAVGKGDQFHKGMLTNYVVPLLCFVVFY